MARKIRYFILVFLPSALFVVFGAWRLKQMDDNLVLVRLQSTQELAVGLGANALTRHLETVRQDLRYLATQEALGRLLNDTGPTALDYLTRDFVAFSNATQIFDQIRWIDETGLERVRVDRIAGAAVVVPQERLQNKGTRYFFTDTMALNPGQVFVSPLDLNIEGNAIEQPYKPMLRFATPVTDQTGRRRGIVILNYLGQVMLDAFSAVTNGLSDDMMLLNNDGYWLKSQDPAEEWGFMLQQPLTLGHRAPGAWSRIRTADRGQERTASGLWTWRTVYPLLSGEVSSAGTAAPAGLSQDRVGQEGYVWKVVSRVDPEQLAALGAQTTRRYTIIVASLLGLLAVVGGLLAQALDGQAKARELLERLATTDGLTGLANRRFFMEQLQRYWSGYQRRPEVPVGVLMLDLDHFKAVNDSHGHATGDMVLQHFANILSAALRQDDMAGRIGGEEFCVLLHGSDLEGVRQFAERVRGQLESTPLESGHLRLTITLSGGGSGFMTGDTLATAAIQRADAALYRAKEAGRNRIELAAPLTPG
jgi:diguanylate cyclase (GGDEF)-like protein